MWLNPPYATGLLASFIEKLVGHVEQGDVSAAIVLVENRTDTEWFHRAAERAARFCFTRGRVRFLRPDGGQPQAPICGSVLLYFGPEPALFADVFGAMGLILKAGTS